MGSLILLTFLLQGKSHNPFSILYILIALISGMLLKDWQFWLTFFFTLCGNAFVYSDLLGAQAHHQHMTGHLQGMWLANSLAIALGGLSIYFLKKDSDRNKIQADKTQKTLAHLEKIDTMGRLMAQLAHKLNTPLGTLRIGLAELSDTQNPLSQKEIADWKKDCEDSFVDIENILHQIRSEKTWINVEKDQSELAFFLEEILKTWAKPRSVSSHFESKIKDYNIAPQIAEKLRDCLLALLENAFQAQTSLDHKKVHVHLEQYNEFIVLSVIDPGIGMSPEIIKKACDPLFTTKEGGTGLGLYACSHFCQSHKGHIEIHSEAWKKTQVSLYFKLD